ncbi:MAG: rRNA cytosine-C5-methyltransferase, partial [Muribaculaceae bacterium]|nr:rRNA cytosine-C5-methyltransferase [Muribaculaceae bacterium]
VVPCSGEGLMGKDETARAQWSKRLVDECAARQRQILQNLWETLRPGGFLIYSTCTFNTDENDNNIDWLTQSFGAIPVPVPVPTQTGILTTPGGAMRFLPSLIRGEGLFMAVLQKPGTPATCNTTSSRKHRKTLPPDKTAKHPQTADAATLARCMKWLNGDFVPQLSGETICAIPSDLSHSYRQLAQHLDLILQGVAIGSSKGRSITPHQGLALSSALNTDAFPTAPLNLSEALSFLRRESLRGFDLPKGPVLLTHQSMPLGFVNNLGNRANNLYPAPWRILH